MTEDQLDAYAERLAHQAIAACEDVADAAGVLVQASMIAALTMYPVAAADAAIEQILQDARLGLAALAAEEGATRQ